MEEILSKPTNFKIAELAKVKNNLGKLKKVNQNLPI